jgi:hypothetical protein
MAGNVAGTLPTLTFIASRSISCTSHAAVDSLTVPPDLVGIEVIPAAVTIEPGGGQAFSAIARLRDSSSQAAAVTWSNTGGGSISAVGDYTAPLTSGNYLVIATLSGSGLADTAEVTVTVTPPAPVSGDIPELPPGYSLRAVHTGSPLVAAGWLTNSDGTSGVSVVDDSLAPASPSQVMRVNYPLMRLVSRPTPIRGTCLSRQVHGSWEELRRDYGC